MCYHKLEMNKEEKVMAQEPLISVIVPVYRVEKYLAKCVESIRGQTYKNLEIILVDDGSPDNSPRLCDELAKNDARIKVFHRKNQGVSNARNFGMQKCSGEFVVFVDGDDFLQPDMYEKLMKKQQQSAADLVFCGFNYASENGIQPVIETELSKFCETGDLNFLFNHSSRKNCAEGKLVINDNVMGCVWRTLFKKDILQGVEFNTNVKFMEDLLFMTDLFIKKKPKCGLVDESLYNYVLRPSSASNDLIEIIVKDSQNFAAAFEKCVIESEYTSAADAFKFFCYFKCVLAKAKSGRKDSLKEVEKFNTSKNYNAHKKFVRGWQNKLKFFLAHHHMGWVLKILVKLKGEKG